MTTIAYSAKHRQIAADRQVTANGIVVGQVTKILRIGSILVGGCGASGLCQRFVAWVAAGMHESCPPMVMGEDKACGILFWNDICVTFLNTEGIPDYCHAPYHAYGSGSEIARTALAMGASPEEAIRIAAQQDIYTGSEVDVLTVPELPLDSHLRKWFGP